MNDTTEVFAIFKELQSTSKKTEKAKILKDNERNILFYYIKRRDINE